MKNTASRKVTTEMTLNFSAWRMKGMSFWMRNSSMCVSPGRSADREAVDLATTAVDEVHEHARDQDGAEHRGQDAQAVHHREAAHRAGAEHQERDAGDQRGHVGIENGAEGAL